MPYIDSLVFNLVISVTHFIVSSINCGMYNYQLDPQNFGIIGSTQSCLRFVVFGKH